MPGTLAGDNGTQFACKCMNVRIRTASTDTVPPESVSDPAYTQVYVGDEGITVEHTQLTLRSRARVTSVPGANRYSRFTTLTCLLCDLPVYRVLQIVPADVEGKDGPILLGEDHVEKEVMKSPTGWIEVSKDTLTGEEIAQTEKKINFSPLFNLVVPTVPQGQAQAPIVEDETTPPTNENGNSSRESSPSPSSEPILYFSHLRPVFQPPPFTPSHPVFLHLASLAETDSQGRRQAAENYIAELIRQKTEEIEREDALIRQQVEAVWKRFRASIKKAQANAHFPISPRSSRTSRSRERDYNRTFARSVSPTYGMIAVRDFVPVSVPVRRGGSPPARHSALSASLATSSFHHPRAHRERSPPAESGGSPDSVSSRTMSTRSGSATLVQPTTSDSVNVLNFRRNVDDTINTQASYRYFLNLEEEMAREKERRQALAKANQDNTTADSQTASSSQDPKINGNGKQTNGASTSDTQKRSSSEKSKEQADASSTFPPRGRDAKGKRKVTFDVEPDVVTIRREMEGEKESGVALPDQGDPRDLIFDIEDLDGEGSKFSSHPPHALPLLEQPTIARPLRAGKARAPTFPEAFASLRPSSLPNPSHIRPMRSQPGVDSSHAMLMSLPHGISPLARRSNRVSGTKSPMSPTKTAASPTDTESRRLASADAHSHRGAWSSDGRHWQNFTRGHSVTETSIPEESEEGGETEEATAGDSSTSVAPVAPANNSKEDKEEESEASDDDLPALVHRHAGIPGSLPIQIHMTSQTRGTLSLASYQPQSAMPLQQQNTNLEAPNGRRMSTAAIRKAVYAERDRSRSMDPGPLDFAAEEEDEEESSEDEAERARIEALLSTTRGRKQALKILQARSELPDSGMWRSLAS